MASASSTAAVPHGPLHIGRIHVYVFQDDAPPAVRSSFGTSTQRTSALIKVEDESGQHGWGEIWSGHPPFGAYHRATILEQLVAPRAVGQTVASIPDLLGALREAMLPMLRLAGEPGPIAHVLAGLDCALWDLAARLRGVPLYRLLGGDARRLPVYASGVSPSIAPDALDALRARGFRAFKFKAGFADDRALDDLARTVDRLAPGESAMIDANCGWDVAQARHALQRIRALPLQWVEEPIGPERPAAEWRALRDAGHRLAAGENLLAREAFHDAFDWLDVVQPDLGKWGGVSQVLPLAREALARGKRYCPHAFGSHIGAALAAHVLCAAGGDGVLELDANPNPLRTLGAPGFPQPVDGTIALDDAPGIGIDADPAALHVYPGRHAVVER
ncbi:mandelate racemase/muconate lactonizing enzyme family protein [Bordetella bronchialis]|uniref:mandelate racemase/muconate lactonizing enzyme family protein n=1 Tax=Bordetella bronchialis TaxID=463025 RepID=UPI003D00F6FC